MIDTTTATARAARIAATVRRRMGLIAALVLAACSGTTGYRTGSTTPVSTPVVADNYRCNDDPGMARVVVVRVTQEL